MREILFRGKLKDNGEWIYGGINTDWGLEPKDRERYWIIQAYCGESLVTSESIGQYTGLTDKNGKKIFEGDIVTNGWGRKETVEFYEGRYYPFIAFPEYNCWDEKECEVIGNIHDNPELLGGEEVE